MTLGNAHTFGNNFIKLTIVPMCLQICIFVDKLQRVGFVCAIGRLKITKKQSIMSSVVRAFIGEFEFLSNFYISPIFVQENVVFASVEHGFQAMKTFDTEWIGKIMEATTPGKAKRLGQKAPLRPDWEDAKMDVMKNLVHLKFKQHLNLREKLLATGDAELVEGNYWHDCFWGVDDKTGKGENHLGKILMAERDSWMPVEST